MKTALFNSNGQSIIIDAREIQSRKDYYERYHEHLFCPFPGCNIPLDYVNSEHPYFRTVKQGQHSEGCPNYVNRDFSSPRVENKRIIPNLLSDEHIQRVLKDAYKLEFQPHEHLQSSHRKHVSKQKNKSIPMKTDMKIVPSLDPNAKIGIYGAREARINKCKSMNIMPDDIGKVKEVHGFINHAEIADDFIKLQFANTSTSIFIYNAFKDKSTQAFTYVKKLGVFLNDVKNNIFICCVGNIEGKGNDVQIQIMDPTHITFDNLTIYNFVFKNAL